VLARSAWCPPYLRCALRVVTRKSHGKLMFGTADMVALPPPIHTSESILATDTTAGARIHSLPLTHAGRVADR
jgi:hypothetical protein